VHHLIGKDILKPHAVFWPAMLHAAGVPLYHRLFVHGYWTYEGQKISKTLGTAIHPFEMDEKYGYEPFRYFLLREMSFGLDADFSHAAVVRRINSDLANDLGNLLSRTLSMLQKYRDGVVPVRAEPSELAPVAARAVSEVDRHLGAFHTQRALGALWELVGAANRLIDSRAPWKLAKEKRETELDAALYEALEALRVIGVLLGPFLPKASAEILASLDEAVRARSASEVVPLAQAAWGGLAPGTRISPSPKGALFPRMETK
jgi:methionyl-tRNA synthetase